jgi:hypothetical protein
VLRYKKPGFLCFACLAGDHTDWKLATTCADDLLNLLLALSVQLYGSELTDGNARAILRVTASGFNLDVAADIFSVWLVSVRRNFFDRVSPVVFDAVPSALQGHLQVLIRCGSFCTQYRLQ